MNRKEIIDLSPIHTRRKTQRNNTNNIDGTWHTRQDKDEKLFNKNFTNIMNFCELATIQTTLTYKLKKYMQKQEQLQNSKYQWRYIY